MIFRTPETLLVMQAAAAGLGAFPLALIVKKFKLSNTNALLIVTAYLFYPALNGGLFWDFHENKFLTVLILWLMYFIVSLPPSSRGVPPEGGGGSQIRKYILVYIFAALVLMVKEDSFLYVFCIALYMISLRKDGRFSKKNIVHGIILAVMSVIYFLFSTYYLKTYGLGVMTYRFNMFLMSGEDGFMAMIVNVVKNPALLLASLISVPEKLEFIFYVLIPLCFLPFISKKLNFVFLIIPMILINLCASWVYQYDINFQYTYGVTALLFFLAVKNLSKINKKHITKLCVAMACFSVILFSSKILNRIDSYNTIYSNQKGDLTEASEMLKKIPLDASVSANEFIVPHLIKIENLYKVNLFTEEYFKYDADYLINDLRGVDTEKYNDFLLEIEARGYEKTDAAAFIEIFKKK